MKVSQNWLKELVDINTTPNELSEKLSIGGFEVESIDDCSSKYNGVILGKVLSVEKHIGVKLTESLAMWPAASVSGYYFGNSNAKYFGIGKIDKDQMIDYAKRRNISFEKAIKWLNPIYNDV